MHVLAIGAHPDDIELGCGGTLVQHVLAGHEVTMLVITNGEHGPGDVTVRQGEQIRAQEALGVQNLVWGGLPDLTVSNYERETIAVIERAIHKFNIDRIYTHGLNDTHQDHRAVALATLGAARKSREVFLYGSPSSFDLTPTVFVDISDTLEKKLDALLCHASQVEASEKVSPEHVRGAALHDGRKALTMAAEGFAVHRYLMAV